MVLLPTYRPPTGTCNVTASLWFSVVNLTFWNMFTEYFKLFPSKATLRDMANHRGVKLCKAKGQDTKNRTANVLMSWTIFTHNFALSGSLWLLCQHLLLLLQLWFCSTVQLALSFSWLLVTVACFFFLSGWTRWTSSTVHNRAASRASSLAIFPWIRWLSRWIGRSYQEISRCYP